MGTQPSQPLTPPGQRARLEARELPPVDPAYYTQGPELAQKALELEAFRQGLGTPEEAGSRIGDRLGAHFHGAALSAALGAIAGLAPELFSAVAKRFPGVEIDEARIDPIMRHAGGLAPLEQRAFLRDVMTRTPPVRREELMTRVIGGLALESAHPLAELVPTSITLGDAGILSLCAAMPDMDAAVQGQVLDLLARAGEVSQGAALMSLMVSQPATFLEALRRFPDALPDRHRLSHGVAGLKGPEPMGVRLNALCAGYARGLAASADLQGAVLKAWVGRGWFASLGEVARAFPAPFLYGGGAAGLVRDLPASLQVEWAIRLWDNFSVSSSGESAAFLRALNGASPEVATALRSQRDVDAVDTLEVPVPWLRHLGFQPPYVEAWNRLTARALDLQLQVREREVTPERFWEVDLLRRSHQLLMSQLSERTDAVMEAIETSGAQGSAELTLDECYQHLGWSRELPRDRLRALLVEAGALEMAAPDRAAFERVVADFEARRPL